ncbi:GNAT family N-acetyltransferase [Natronorubrum sulfidifaciens]|uniref:N-acetyltransferase GCN5 n=1 Tax=Natronorubrum sulfidifaciens JCM 14089 TaxID=1230460 RepID=L9W1Y9_9EURY|nr:GNAT family N-acetyltransferase [Natronorubrum sulfidifaciens]ELY43465.1 N-acetyltransferase GCN5 [Natronorubrum sulfidifaciens JCM 14089]
MAPHTNSQPTIEHATHGDIDAVADCWVRLARDQRAYGSVVCADDNRATMRETLAAYQVNDGLLVARVDGHLVGFASFTVEHGTLDLDVTRGHLSNIYVEPNYRGRGIGTALLEAVEDALADRGVEALALEVMADNEAARRFYARQGYDTHRVTMARSLTETASSKNDTHSKEDH